MIRILGGAKTGYNLYKVFEKNNISSEYFYSKNEYGERKKEGKPFENYSFDPEDRIIVSSETAFVHFKSDLETILPANYYLREKSNLASIAEKLGVSNISNLSLAKIEFPVFVKPKTSGEKIVPFKTKIIRSQRELDEISQYVENCFIQEYLHEKKYEQIDIGGYFTGSVNSLMSFKENNQYPMGIASYVSLFSSKNCDRLRIAIASLLNDLGYRGFVEMEFKRNIDSDTFLLMDINPRPWGSFYYYLAAVQNLKEIVLEGGHPILNFKKSWINFPRLCMSNLKGNFKNPSVTDIITNKVCYEPIIKF